MTLKTVEEWIHVWADDWHDTRRLIEAVREEFASEAATMLRREVDASMRTVAALKGVQKSAHLMATRAYDHSLRIVEALGRHASATVSFPALPIDPEADKLVDGLLAKARHPCDHRAEDFKLVRREPQPPAQFVSLNYEPWRRVEPQCAHGMYIKDAEHCLKCHPTKRDA